MSDNLYNNEPFEQEQAVRDAVFRRSIQEGVWLDRFTAIPEKKLSRLPKCLMRDENGKIVERPK